MFATLIAWVKTFFQSALSHYVMPVWHDIETKVGPDLAEILAAGLAVASKGHTAIFDAVDQVAKNKAIELLDYEIGFIANMLQHPAAATATTPVALPVPAAA